MKKQSRDNQKENERRRSNLTIFYSMIVAFVLLVTMICMTALIFSFLKFGLIPEPGAPNFLGVIMFIAIISIIIGTMFSAALNQVPLKPLRQMINATKELADGNFDVRIDLNGTKEYEELTESFNKMAEELGSIEMLRGDFINNFSHEFKTPIVSMCGFAKILKNDNLTKEERDEYLDIIISESNRLSVLATNVLNLTKIENQSIVPNNKKFDMAEQIRRSILILEPKWSKKQLDLLINLDEVTYYGNEDLMSQVWINLIDNAIKFTPHNGNISIKLMNLDNSIVFKVKDNGQGIDEDTQKHIFDKFYQGDASHATQGNGLGLTVAKKIVELCKGRVSVSSKIQEGTTFTVIIPK